jgi:hypothetical protein
MKSTTFSFPIPVIVIQNITNFLDDNYPSIPLKHKTKLLNTLTQLWLRIYISHESTKSTLEESFCNEHLNNIYTHIHSNKLIPFSFRLSQTSLLNYNELLSILEACGTININNKYSVNKKFTKSYRPHTEINYSITQNIEICISKLTKNAKNKEELITKNPEYSKLINDLYLVKVNLVPFFETMEALLGKPYKIVKGTELILSPSVLYQYKIKAIKINLGIHFFSVASTGRIYSSLSNLPKSTLPFITLAGRKTIEIDAVNSQPLLLSSLITNIQFKNDCETGIFYNKMAQHLGITRDEFKIQSYATIFFNNKKISGKIAEQLESIYPGIVTEINQFKTTSKKAASKLNQSELLWYKLQSSEAQIWIKTAKQPLTPIITRHDSIICWENEATSLLKTLKSEYKKIGITATFKVSKT